jgi:DNA polymerase-1
MNDTWLIIDTDYLCHRARWSMRDLSWKGAATGTIYGVLQTVLQLQERFQTDKVAFCFDSHVSKRQEIYPAYKANRKNRQPLTAEEERFEKEFRRQVIKLRKEYLPEIGFRNIFWQSGYESDDLIARLAIDFTISQCFPKGTHYEGVIVSADHDLYQCITGHVRFFNFKGTMTLQRFKQEFGLIPSQWAVVKSIAGCSTDNVQGIKGVGEKTAVKYLRGLLKPTSKAFRAIEAGKDIIKRNEKLTRLPLHGVDIPNLREDQVTKEGWDSVCHKLGFKSLRGRLPRMGR